MFYLIVVLTLIFPLFFFPLITDPLLGAKSFFLAAGVLLVLVIAGLRLVRAKKLAYSIKSLDVLIFLLLIVSWISWFLMPIGARVRSLTQPLGIGSITALALFYYAIVELNLENKAEKILRAFLIASVVISLASVVAFVVPEKAPQLLKNVLSWLTFGSPFLVFQFLLPAAVLMVRMIIGKGKKEGKRNRLRQIILGVVLFVGVGVSLYQLVKTKPVFLDWFSSWAVTAETFKRKPFTGIGPGNFSTAFNLYRPGEFNQTDNWALRFSAPRSWFLQVWSEVGIIGFALLVLILFRTLPLLKKNKVGWFLATTWLLLIFTPGNLASVFVLFLALALVRGKGEERSFSLIVGDKGKDGAPPIAGVLLIIVSLVAGYFVVRYFWSEVLFYRSFQAAAQNKGGDTYNLQLKAIGENNLSTKFRTAFAQTNLALAIALASKGDQLTEQERSQITQLMSQSVSEAKAVVALDPQDVVGWENLAQVYRQLVGVAEGADQWVVATYQQAISLDPLNPRIRVDYAGLLYAMGGFNESSRQLEVAVNLRPTYANAWYNWAWALKKLNVLEDAVIKMQQAVNLVDQSSADYEKANGELDQWKEELGKVVAAAEKEKEQPTELTTPEPLPTPKLEKPIELPEEAAPPLEENKPESTVTPTSAATPTAEPTEKAE